MRNAGTKILSDGSVSIMLPLTPYTKKNSQNIFHKNITKADGTEKKVPFVSPSTQYKQYEKDCGIFLRPLGIQGPVNIRAYFYMKTFKAVDLTNLNEALHDILQAYGVIAEDNCRVVAGTDGSRVFYDKDNPRTEVLITGMEATFPEPKRRASCTGARQFDDPIRKGDGRVDDTQNRNG